MIAIHLNAGNDVNGNPRRLYLVVDTETGMAMDAVNEGYSGRGALGEAGYEGVVIGPQVQTSPAEYRRLLKWAREKGSR